MNKPDIQPMLPMPESVPAAGTNTPKAVIHQPGPVSQVASLPPISPGLPSRPTGPGSAYVDPYLFETGYYTSWAEYQELSRTVPARLQLRADVENARPKRKNRK